MLFIIPIVYGANWVDDPADCENEYNTISCLPLLVCGITGSDTPYCYDTSSLTPPGSSESNNAGDTYQSSFNGGFIIDCESTDAGEPYCDNSEGFYCNRNNTCYNSYHRQTVCSADLWANSSCGICRTDGNDYNDCDTDDFDCETRDGTSCGSATGIFSGCLTVESGGTGNCVRISDYLDCDDDDSDANELTCNGVNGCEVNPQTTNYPTGTNNHYEDCTTCGCDTGYESCGADTCAVEGCNYQVNIVCATNAKNLSSCAGCTCDSGWVDTNSDLSLGLAGDGCDTAKSYPPIFAGNKTTVYTYSNESSVWVENTGSGPLMNLSNTTGSFIVDHSGCIIFPQDPTNPMCTVPTGGGGASPFTNVDNKYIYNDSGTITFNETKLNITTNASIDSRVGAGDGNFTVTLGKIFLAYLDLAELDNSVSAFITTAVSTLTNYALTTNINIWISTNKTDTETTLRDNIDTNVTYLENSIDSIENLTMQEINDSFGNWSQDKPDYISNANESWINQTVDEPTILRNFSKLDAGNINISLPSNCSSGYAMIGFQDNMSATWCLDVVEPSELDNSTIVRSHNTTWITDNVDLSPYLQNDTDARHPTINTSKIVGDLNSSLCIDLTQNSIIICAGCGLC